jgi:hypothetical protein
MWPSHLLHYYLFKQPIKLNQSLTGGDIVVAVAVYIGIVQSDHRRDLVAEVGSG